MRQHIGCLTRSESAVDDVNLELRQSRLPSRQFAGDHGHGNDPSEHLMAGTHVEADSFQVQAQ